MEKVNNWSTLVNGRQSTTRQWRSMVGERERGVTLVRVTLMWNLFVVAYQVCNIKNNIFPLSKSKFFFTLFVFFFNGDKRKCFLGSTFCAVSNIMKYGEKKTEHKYILIYLSHCVFSFFFVFLFLFFLTIEGGGVETHIFFPMRELDNTDIFVLSINSL